MTKNILDGACIIIIIVIIFIIISNSNNSSTSCSSGNYDDVMLHTLAFKSLQNNW